MLTRILAAAVGLPLLLAIILFLPSVATAILFAAACAIGAYEMLWRTGILKHKRILCYTVLMAVATVLWSWAMQSGRLTGEKAWLAALAGLFVFFVALFCELLAAHTALSFTSLFAAVFSGVIYPLLIASLARLRCMDAGHAFPYLTLTVFLLSMIADSGAYFVGRACGKHKLAPVVSPKKTWEGVIGGVICNIAFMLLYLFLISKFCGVTVRYWTAPIYGVLGAAASVVGDLTLSVVKRQVKLKDYGNLIPGHGGILDRFDSTMLVAPLTELLVLLLPFAV